MSRGAFDITIEPLSSLWDFTGKTPHVPPEEEIEADLKKVGYENVLLDGRQVTFLNDETTIDLGAIAKGFIADEGISGRKRCEKCGHQSGRKCALRGKTAGRRPF